MSGRRLGDKWLIFSQKTGRIACRLLFSSQQDAISHIALMSKGATKAARKVQIREAK